MRQAFRRAAGEPDHSRLYRLLQGAIDSEQLTPGLRLPSSRQLAQTLGIARNTVVHVYAQLALEGSLRAGVGRGTYVSAAAAVLSVGDLEPAHGAGAQLSTTTRLRLLSRRGTALLDGANAASLQWGAFTPGVPEVRLFPSLTWSRLQARLWRQVTPPQLSYATSGGDAGLRYAIAEHLREHRGMNCTAEQVVVTSGTQQSLHLVAQLLADPGDAVWIEDPGYWGARSVFGALGLKPVPVGLDAEGLSPSPRQLKAPPRLMFVSPAHQYPMGVLMSQPRRRQLLDYAALRGVWVIEDDYDSDFRYASRPLPALQKQDRHGRVIYLGTFSKTLFPAMRLAYLVLPPALVDPFARALSELYREGQTPQQAVLARFMSEGHYANHIRRMRGVYGARHDQLLLEIKRHFGSQLPVFGGDAGLHLVLGLPKALADQAVAQAVADAGVSTRPLSIYSLKRHAPIQGLLLGYGAVDEADIARHFATLVRVVQARMRSV